MCSQFELAQAQAYNFPLSGVVESHRVAGMPT